MSLFNYFTKLGSVSYNNDIVTNIITSVRFKEAVEKQVTVFYPYTIQEGERPDTIAFKYYEDERYAWLVYLSNSIIDPYYEWPLSLNDFNKLILKKYGSIEKSLNKVAFFRNAWYKDDTMLSVSGYNALSTGRKKYWNPIYGYNDTIGSYERKKEDRVVDTNRIVELTLTTSTTGIILGERVKQGTASGDVLAIKSNSVVVSRIRNTFTAGGGLTFEDSGESRVSSDVDTIYTAIPADEEAYWEPVSYYDYENELNESRKHIKLIDRQYLTTIEDQMLELLS